MHDTRAREIEKAHFVQEAAAPFPEALHRINKPCQDNRKRKKRPELHALGNRTGDNRHCRCDEHDLEEEVGQVRVVRVTCQNVCDLIVALAKQATSELKEATDIVLTRVHDCVAHKHVHDAGD